MILLYESAHCCIFKITCLSRDLKVVKDLQFGDLTNTCTYTVVTEIVTFPSAPEGVLIWSASLLICRSSIFSDVLSD